MSSLALISGWYYICTLYCTPDTDVMVSWAEIKIVCLVSRLIMTKIVSNLKDDGSFLMKSIEMEFHGHSEIESCLRDL